MELLLEIVTFLIYSENNKQRRDERVRVLRATCKLLWRVERECPKSIDIESSAADVLKWHSFRLGTPTGAPILFRFNPIVGLGWGFVETPSSAALSDDPINFRSITQTGHAAWGVIPDYTPVLDALRPQKDRLVLLDLGILADDHLASLFFNVLSGELPALKVLRIWTNRKQAASSSAWGLNTLKFDKSFTAPELQILILKCCHLPVVPPPKLQKLTLHGVSSVLNYEELKRYLYKTPNLWYLGLDGYHIGGLAHPIPPFPPFLQELTLHAKYDDVQTSFNDHDHDHTLSDLNGLEHLSSLTWASDPAGPHDNGQIFKIPLQMALSRYTVTRLTVVMERSEDTPTPLSKRDWVARLQFDSVKNPTLFVNTMHRWVIEGTFPEDGCWEVYVKDYPETCDLPRIVKSLPNVSQVHIQTPDQQLHKNLYDELVRFQLEVHICTNPSIPCTLRHMSDDLHRLRFSSSTQDTHF